MEIVPIEQYVRENVSRFELASRRGKRHCFNLYGKNGYCGEFGNYGPSKYMSEGYGISAPTRVLSIFDNSNGKLNLIMEKINVRTTQRISVKDHSREIPVKSIPQIITIMTTYLDFINDYFQTIKRESVLKNNLVRIGKNDPDFYYNEEHAIYEELTEKPAYEQNIEIVREGSISEAKEKAQRRYFGKQQRVGLPFIFW